MKYSFAILSIATTGLSIPFMMPRAPIAEPAIIPSIAHTPSGGFAQVTSLPAGMGPFGPGHHHHHHGTGTAGAPYPTGTGMWPPPLPTGTGVWPPPLPTGTGIPILPTPTGIFTPIIDSSPLPEPTA